MANGFILINALGVHWVPERRFRRIAAVDKSSVKAQRRMEIETQQVNSRMSGLRRVQVMNSATVIR